ncbi:MAG: pitrilysin family protein [Pirellulales bacterium]|nr:pitrilysin family protein [Pirellulales bacterium]
MPQKFFQHTLTNGLVIVAEEMPGLESVAFSWQIPAGTIYEPADGQGLSALTCDLMLRGAGERDSREFLSALENLGVQRGEGVSSSHMSFGAATVAENLPATLEIYADLLLRPHMPEKDFAAAQQVVLQELLAIEDDPAHKVMQHLRRQHYPDPWGRPSEGEAAAIERATIQQCLSHYQRLIQPADSILAIAGKLDWPRVLDQVTRLFGDWRPVPPAKVPRGARGAKLSHLPHESAQIQIGIAYESVPFNHPDYFQASGGVGVLSGGMSSRLFTEVREKRNLCYSVYASYHTHKDLASVICYAGTSADRAQETLDVTLGELKRLPLGIEESELNRLKARVKSGLIMQQESSSARAGAIAREWYHLGRVRTLAEIGQKVDELSVESINAYLRRQPPRDFTVVTIGPRELQVAE